MNNTSLFLSSSNPEKTIREIERAEKLTYTLKGVYQKRLLDYIEELKKEQKRH